MKSCHRLRKNEQYQDVFQNGKSFANRYLVLYYKPQDEVTEFHVGLSVSKKVGNAVIRNRVKRLIRAVISELSEQISEGFDMIFVARPQAAELDYHLMKKNIIHVLKNAGILK
jgi:ribonuclease P protein component